MTDSQTTLLWIIPLVWWLAAVGIGRQLAVEFGRQQLGLNLTIIFGPLGLLILACLGRTPAAEARHRRQIDEALQQLQQPRKAGAARAAAGSGGPAITTPTRQPKQ